MALSSHEHRSASGFRLNLGQTLALGVLVAGFAWAGWMVQDRPMAEEVELLPGTVLPSSELAIVEAAFDRAQLSDHRTEDGRVWVPRQRQSAYMRALVDGEALPREFGSSLRRALEKNSPWQSRAVQEEMLRVAVQEELAHVICSMPGIERAAVLYDAGDRAPVALTIGGGRAATASVNIRTQADVELETARVQAIRILVAASIAGLDAERVAVTDLRSGRVHAGPLLVRQAEEEDAAADPTLARRAAHERHLAAKIRQGLAFVKGAVVDVSVTFRPEESDPDPTNMVAGPPPDAAATSQRPAQANAPAEVDFTDGFTAPAAHEEARYLAAGASASSSPEVIAARRSTRVEAPASIVATVVVPDTWVQAMVLQAATPDAPTDPAELEQRELERLAAHVRGLLPILPQEEDCRVVVTSFPTPERAVRPSPQTIPPANPAAARTVGSIIDATIDAVARRDTSAVPREAWLAAVAVSAAILAGLVLVAGGPHDRRRERPRRRGQPRIDWSGLEDERAEPSPSGRSQGTARGVAA
jgi:type III secretory pathway lipoprotein EscJ